MKILKVFLPSVLILEIFGGLWSDAGAGVESKLDIYNYNLTYTNYTPYTITMTSPGPNNTKNTLTLQTNISASAPLSCSSTTQPVGFNPHKTTSTCKEIVLLFQQYATPGSKTPTMPPVPCVVNLVNDDKFFTPMTPCNILLPGGASYMIAMKENSIVPPVIKTESINGVSMIVSTYTINVAVSIGSKI